MSLFIWVHVQVRECAWVHVDVRVLVCGSLKDDIGCPLLGSTLLLETRSLAEPGSHRLGETG